ncbi:MAG: hypothetical protein QNJ94_12145, partial [Alphaproteobacteria bacterium]|nr:hypothetical protein [Alphaproteobacteria bacterium]
AASLAARLRAEIDAVFLEDENLLRSAELPFVRRINLLSAAAETFDTAGAERELRLLANQLRRTLATEAARRQVPWRFRVVRGRAEVEVPAAARGCDLVIVAGGDGGAARRVRGRWSVHAAAVRCPGPVMLLPGRAPELAGPVVAIYDAGEQADRVLRLAAQLAAAQEQPLIVLATARTAAETAPLGERATQWLAERGIKADVRQAIAAGMDRLVAQVQESRGHEAGGTTVIAAASPLMTEESAIAALERLAGAVLMVRQ